MVQVVVKSNYTTSVAAAKASVRYIEHRPRGADEPTRALFTKEGPISRQEAYALLDAHHGRGIAAHRLILSPSDDAHPDDLRAMTRALLGRLETARGQTLHWVAVEHRHTDNPHVHVLLCGTGERDGTTRQVRLTPRDFQQLREDGRDYYRAYGREGYHLDRAIDRAADRLLTREQEREPRHSHDRAPATPARWIAQRAASWERDGLTPAAARTLATLEHERGTTFTTRAEAKAEIDRRWGTLHRAGDTLQRERAALAAAAQAQARHEQAVTAAAEHDGRGAALHRLLSAEARAARAAARRDLDQAEREVRATGAHDRAALAQRERALRPRELAYWRQRDVLEPLAAARAAITRVDREHARQERDRSPGHDRGDDFGR